MLTVMFNVYAYVLTVNGIRVSIFFFFCTKKNMKYLVKQTKKKMKEAQNTKLDYVKFNFLVLKIFSEK